MDDVLTYVRYPFVDGDGTDGIVIATVRPATILGDVAVAVHPDDPRYRDAVGREVVVPYVERAVPVIADARVEPSFGSGALKITPGHDPLDFEIGRAHGLPEPMVIGLDGRMNDQAGDLEGLTQAEADAAIVAWIKERGQLVERENYRHSVGTCERCHSRIEPLISLQWWCAMKGPAAPAIEALRERRVRFHPESQHRFAIASLEEIPDWCLSRQIWWGHQLPIWTTPSGEVICATTEEEAQERAGAGVELTRDPDVLDTWFSSALWPFATLGWPEQTPELEAYYPGNVNSTAREIIRLWENRMIWAGLELMGEVPFTDVIIHSTVLAADGRRMSKSLGTGVDPLEMIEAHGADATRYGLLKISSTQDVRFSPGAIEEGRKLANKLWNVSRLILQNAEGIEPAVDPTALEERWILARIDLAREQVEEAWGAFDFATATNVLYHLTFDDFCDWYAEAVKPRLYEHEPAACATALPALERLLALLHPVIPHVTEEIWSHLPGARKRLIVSAWPAPDGELSRGEQRPRPRAGRRGDVPAERGAGGTRLRRRAPRLRGRRPARAPEGAGRCRPRDRAAAEGDRPRGGDARERALRRQRPRRGRRRGARQARALPARAGGARRHRELRLDHASEARRGARGRPRECRGARRRPERARAGAAGCDRPLRRPDVGATPGRDL